MNYKTLTALCVALGALTGTPATANMVINGDFETGDLSGWMVAGDGVGIDNAFPNTGNFDAAFGAPSSDPDPGVLSQDLTTVAGQEYTLAFALADESGLPTNPFTVTFGGFAITITGDQAAFAYASEVFDVPGTDITGATTTLTFTGTNDFADWNLDDVSVLPVVAAVPEPSSASLLASALFVGLLYSRRFRRYRQIQ